MESRRPAADIPPALVSPSPTTFPFHRANEVRQKGNGGKKKKTRKGLASLSSGSKRGWHATPATWRRACIIHVAAPAECAGAAATEGFIPLGFHCMSCLCFSQRSGPPGRSQSTWAADRRPLRPLRPLSAVTHSNIADSQPPPTSYFFFHLPPASA